MDNSKQPSTNLILATGIFTVLFAVYLLSYSGVFHSGDEIFYVLNAMDFIQGDAASVGKGGPYVLVIGFATRVMEILGVDARLQVLFLINIPITALTAVFLFLLAVELGYEARIAVLVALLFGLTTPAWVYSKALFREPWAALGLAAALFFVVRFRRRKSLWDLVLGLLSLALAVTTRTSTAVVLPFFFVYVATAVRRSTIGHHNLSRQLKLALLLLLSVLTAIGLWLAFDAYYPLATRLFQSLTDPQPLAGILISPGRGLFVYAPVLLLSVASLGIFYRQHPGETLLIGGSVAAYILILAAWPKWWGGWGWGPRFLVPFVPFLILPLAATLERVLAQQRWLWLGILLLVLALVGAVIQLTGVLVGPSMPAFNLDSPNLTFDLSSSPLAWSLAIWDRASLDLAWLQLGDNAVRMLSVLLPILLTTVLGAYLLRSTVGGAWFDQRSLLVAAAASLILLLLAAVVALNSYNHYDLRYRSPSGFDAALGHVLDQAQAGDVLVVERKLSDVVPLIALHDDIQIQDPHIYRSRVLNRCLGDCLPYDEVIREEWAVRPDALEWTQYVTGDFQRIWYMVTDVVGQQPRPVESALDQISNRQDCRWFSSSLKVCLYNNLPLKAGIWREDGFSPAIVRYPLDVRFSNGMRLIGYDLQSSFVGSESGEHHVRLSLLWQSDSTSPTTAAGDGDVEWWNANEFDIFANLTDGVAVRQTANLAFVGKRLLTRASVVASDHEFVIPWEIPVDKAFFEVGLLNHAADPNSPNHNQRIAIVDQAGQTVGDMMTLGGLILSDSSPPEAEQPPRARVNFLDRIQLIGLEIAQGTDGSEVMVTLTWRAFDRPSRDYTAFVHLIDQEQIILAQHDQPPGGVGNPTHLWAPNEMVRTSFPLRLPTGVELDNLMLRIGLYDPLTGERLPIMNLTDDQVIAPDGTYLLIPLEAVP